ncbi:hypothetical protein SO694_0000858 [Aureococcus anophagefferens]|uniref:ABC1 atypical kinase-like domain-containing protein n=1 Tax=Aureococcus anophagefferens TaxID=44056 RepID=A0ABR1GDM5_AURAN
MAAAPSTAMAPETALELAESAAAAEMAEYKVAVAALAERVAAAGPAPSPKKRRPKKRSLGLPPEHGPMVWFATPVTRLSPPRVMVCSQPKGAIVRGGVEKSSGLVLKLAKGMEVVVDAEATATDGTPRVRLVDPVAGWASAKTLELVATATAVEEQPAARREPAVTPWASAAAPRRDCAALVTLSRAMGLRVAELDKGDALRRNATQQCVFVDATRDRSRSNAVLPPRAAGHRCLDERRVQDAKRRCSGEEGDPRARRASRAQREVPFPARHADGDFGAAARDTAWQPCDVDAPDFGHGDDALSWLTAIVYLNDDFDGGETTFFVKGDGDDYGNAAALGGASAVLGFGYASEMPSREEDLPRRWDGAAIEAYWDARPFATLGRACAIARTVAPGRDALVALGPAFIKLGQALSIRPDVVPAAALDERGACATPRGRSHDDGAATIEAEVGAMAFGGLDASTPPVAAASLGQVYKVELEGRTVALKRPYDEALVEAFSRGAWSELDYEAEAANQEDMAAKLALATSRTLRRNVHIPAVRLRSRKVLATDWVDGDQLCRASKAEIARLVPLGAELFMWQMLGVGTYHCDPHPGNLLVDAQGRLALIDFGLCTEIDVGEREALTKAVVHLIQGAVPGALYPVLSRVFEDARLAARASPDVAAVKKRRKEFAAVSADLNDIFFNYPFSVPDFFALITRALIILEGIAISGDPDFDIFKAAYPPAPPRGADLRRQGLADAAARRAGLPRAAAASDGGRRLALLLASVSALEIVSKTLPLQVGTPIAKPCRIAAPANIAFREDFQAVDAQLDLGKQAIVVENAANAVPTDAWDAVPPTDWKCVLPEARGDARSDRRATRRPAPPALRGLADEHQASLVDCIAKLSGELARACDARGVDALHVSRVEGAAPQPCPKFHADTVQARCIATLAGRGTQVLPDDAVDHESESPYTRSSTRDRYRAARATPGPATRPPRRPPLARPALRGGAPLAAAALRVLRLAVAASSSCSTGPGKRRRRVLRVARRAPPPRPGLAAIQHELAASIMRMIVGSKHPMSALDGKKIGFVGAGAMATAIMQGLLKRGVDASRLMASDPYAGCRERAAASGIATTESNAAVAAACDVIVVAVKPGVVGDALRALAPSANGKLVVSIAAGRDHRRSRTRASARGCRATSL